ncbi:glycine-rich domain-containing protein [Pseudoalteromonas sp. SaAl2]
MMQSFNGHTFTEALAKTKKWDFELAIQKLIDSNPEQWSLERAEKAILDYQRYMAVTKALGGIQLVPNADIDEIWHMHILDTRAYMQDCNALFGEFLHHYPYFGMLSEENQQQWVDVQAQSEELWHNLFNESLYSKDSVAQKCPQVCPCHVDQLSIGGSTSALLKSA